MPDDRKASPQKDPGAIETLGGLVSQFAVGVVSTVVGVLAAPAVEAKIEKTLPRVQAAIGKRLGPRESSLEGPVADLAWKEREAHATHDKALGGAKKGDCGCGPTCGCDACQVAHGHGLSGEDFGADELGMVLPPPPPHGPPTYPPGLPHVGPHYPPGLPPRGYPPGLPPHAYPPGVPPHLGPPLGSPPVYPPAELPPPIYWPGVPPFGPDPFAPPSRAGCSKCGCGCDCCSGCTRLMGAGEADELGMVLPADPHRPLTSPPVYIPAASFPPPSYPAGSCGRCGCGCDCCLGCVGEAQVAMDPGVSEADYRRAVNRAIEAVLRGLADWVRTNRSETFTEPELAREIDHVRKNLWDAEPELSSRGYYVLAPGDALPQGYRDAPYAEVMQATKDLYALDPKQASFAVAFAQGAGVRFYTRQGHVGTAEDVGNSYYLGAGPGFTPEQYKAMTNAAIEAVVRVISESAPKAKGAEAARLLEYGNKALSFLPQIVDQLALRGIYVLGPGSSMPTGGYVEATYDDVVRLGDLARFGASADDLAKAGKIGRAAGIKFYRAATPASQAGAAPMSTPAMPCPSGCVVAGFEPGDDLGWAKTVLGYEISIVKVPEVRKVEGLGAAKGVWLSDPHYGQQARAAMEAIIASLSDPEQIENATTALPEAIERLASSGIYLSAPGAGWPAGFVEATAAEVIGVQGGWEDVLPVARRVGVRFYKRAGAVISGIWDQVFEGVRAAGGAALDVFVPGAGTAASTSAELVKRKVDVQTGHDPEAGKYALRAIMPAPVATVATQPVRARILVPASAARLEVTTPQPAAVQAEARLSDDPAIVALCARVQAEQKGVTVAGTEQQQENLGLAPAPMRPPSATLLPGSSYTNPGPSPLWIVNPASFQDWLNRNYIVRIQHLRDRVRRASAAAMARQYGGDTEFDYDPADEYYYAMGGVAEGIDGLEKDGQNLGAAVAKRPVLHIPRATRPAPPPSVALPRPVMHIGAPQMEIARLKAALARCQQEAARTSHPTRAQLQAIKAKHLQHMIWEMEQALHAAGELIAEQNRALESSMIAGEDDDLGRARARGRRRRRGLHGVENYEGEPEEAILAGDDDDVGELDDVGRARIQRRRRRHYGLHGVDGRQDEGYGPPAQLAGPGGEAPRFQLPGFSTPSNGAPS